MSLSVFTLLVTLAVASFMWDRYGRDRQPIVRYLSEAPLAMRAAVRRIDRPPVQR